MGNPAMMPVRMFATTVLGHSAMMEASLGTVIGVGIAAHLVLSAIFGLIYGAINGTFSMATETSWRREGVMGFVFGAMLWLINFQIVGRIAYPSFLGAPHQMAMHAMFFGLPLGLMYAGAERSVRHFARGSRVPA